MTTLADLDTPFAVVDTARVARNVQRLRAHVARLGVPLRLHVKTAKCLEVASLVFDGGPGPIAVSTLAEAEFFADAGHTDIVYAVGIAPAKLPRVLTLLRRGVDLVVLLDSTEQARAVAEASRGAGVSIPALIEIDCDGHRSGLHPEDERLLDIAREVARCSELRGLLTHAGESYEARSSAELRAAADNERDCAVRAAERLRGAGHACPVVSVGSTPTAHAATHLTGITDVRAGNFAFFDLTMADLGVCDIDDLALSVVVSVIGHQTHKGWIITDGGWTAVSRDHEPHGHGYGLVADLAGRLLPGLVMVHANQEHGVLMRRTVDTPGVPDLPIGTRLRVLPHHACATAGQHRAYQVVEGLHRTDEAPPVVSSWQRVGGW